VSKRAYRVRVSHEQAHDLEVLAALDGVRVTEEIREAVTSHLAARRDDPDVRRRLRETLEQPV
jgi:hypothetical protein